ncbi:Pre-mRNA-splicing factor spp2 [Hypsizygus marmoreus]|uniref:Pre-mRNA-splicing factor spp2 n=1 Tax=Hypsizygus marmoreus TaxID=39966 RepID=A0A369JTQ9_HYPMA|nr:Pre-mRNA-splicing factor spp2 [Hypsizygus marmoreus]
MSTTEKVSFTIRRPTPVSRAPSSGADSDTAYKIPSLPRHITNPSDSAPGSPLARSTASSPGPASSHRAIYHSHEQGSSDEEEDVGDELVTGFDRFGVQRLNREKKAKATPLVIAALKNRDWREFARKRRSAAQYVPPSAKAVTGKDGSVGGLGVKDSINSGPVLSGLQFKGRPATVKREDGIKEEDGDTVMAPPHEDVKMEEDDEDKRALRAILAETNGVVHEGPIIDVIPTPISEADAYKQDVEDLPDVATLDDYARVPVSQFGAALLRGMGWKEGTAATRQPGKGMVEPYLPAARPALLGIGAKEQEVLDDGRQRKAGATKRPEKRYVPLMKKEKEGERSSSTPESRSRPERSRSPRPRNGASTTVSRRSSRSRERDSDRDYRRRDRERDYRRDDRDRDRERDRRRGDSDRDRRSDYPRDSDRRKGRD